MAQTSGDFSLSYPQATDAVNVHSDIEQLATDVRDALEALDLSIIQVTVINDEPYLLSAGTPVYASGYNVQTLVKKALPSTTNPIFGLLKTDLASGAQGVVVVAGVLRNVNTSSFTTGDVLYVSEEGFITNTRPVGGSGAVGVVAHAANTGVIIVEAKGNGTWGALKDGLS
jgi:hypothetical protein